MSSNERLKYFRTKVVYLLQENFANSIYLSDQIIQKLKQKLTFTNRIIEDICSLSEEWQKEVSKYITAIIAAKKKEEED